MKDMQLSEDVMITVYESFTNLSQFQFQGSFEGWIQDYGKRMYHHYGFTKIQFIEEENYFEDSVNTIE
jgi:hypothetical protein